MPSVDNKVVSVKFDNADFQNKIGPTLQGLDKLKQGLNLQDQAKSLDTLNEAGRRFSLAGMAESLDTIAGKFNAMGAVAFTVINNVVNQMINAATQIAKSFTLDPVMAGLQEYELNMGSIQTILANTADAGTTLDQVTGSLDNLNEYADKTIYNFGQMAKNIGTFTAAGVNLDDSTNAIKGISNLSAMAGSTAEQAAGVMYQLSQAMSAGKVTAVDWLSVNAAGIGGPLQKQLFESAKALGKLTGVPLSQTFDEWKKAGGDFKKEMEKGTFTSEVLKTALTAMSGEMSKEQLIAKGYSESQADYVLKTAKIAENAATEVKTFTQLMSTLKEAVGTGWAESFKKVIGNFEEAKTLFTGLSSIFGGIINKQAEQRNGLLEGWRWFGGREALLQSLRNVLWSLFQIINSVKTAFRDIFPAMTPERLANLTKSFEKFTSKLILGGDTLEKIKNVFSGFFSILKAGWIVIKTVAGAITNFFSAIDVVKAAPGGLLTLFGKIGEGAKDLVAIIGDGSSIRTFLDKYLSQTSEFINNISSKIQPMVEKIGEGFEKLKTFFSDLFTKDAANGYEKFTNAVGESTNRLEQRWDQLVSAGDRIKEFFGKFKNFFVQIKDELRNVFDKLGETFKQGDFDKTLDVVNAGLLGGLLVVFRKFVKEGIKFDIGNGFFDKVGTLVDKLTDSLSIMQDRVKAELIKSIAIALAILTASVVVLSLIDSVALTKSLVALGAFFGGLVGSLKALDGVLTGKGALKIPLITAGLVILSFAVIGFASALAILAKIDPDGLVRGGIALGGIFTAIGIFIYTLKSPARFIELGVGLAAVGVSLFIMAKALNVLAQIPWPDILKGSIIFTGLFALITIFVEAAPEKKLISTGLGLIIVAGSLFIFAQVLERLAAIPFGDLVEGLFGFSGIMLVLAVALKAFPSDMPSLGLGLFLISRALMKMVDVVKAFGDMEWDVMIKGIYGTGAVLLLLAGALKIMEGSLKGGLSMVLAAGAMFMMYNVVKLFSELGIGGIAVGLIGFAGAIGVVAIASMLLSEAIPFMFGLGLAMLAITGSFAVFGLGVLAIAGGVYLLVQAIKALQEIGITGVRAFLEVLPEIATAGAKAFIAFVVTVIEAIPQILGAFSEVFESVKNFMIENLPKLGEIFRAIIDFIIPLVRENLPRLQELGYEMLITLLKGVKDNIFEITILVSDIIIAFMYALSFRIEMLVWAGLNLLKKFLQGIADNIGLVYGAAGEVVAAVLRGIGFVIGQLVDAGGDIIIRLIEGFGKKQREILDAATNVVILFGLQLAIEAIRMVDAAFTILTVFLNGLADTIRKRSNELRDAGFNIATAIIDGLTGGMATKAGEVWESFKNMAREALGRFASIFEVKSPSRVMFKMAGYIVQGLVNGLNADTSLNRGMETLGNNAIVTLNNALRKNVDLAGAISDSNPTITPVLDLTNVKRGMTDLNRTLGTPVIDTDVSFGQASSLALATRLQEALSASDGSTGPSSVTKDFKFEQNIYAPKELSMAEIYRQTKSQIAFAKEGLEELTNEDN